MNEDELKDEEKNLKELLENRIVSNIHRHKKSELVIVFSDGTKLLIDQSDDALELSVT